MTSNMPKKQKTKKHPLKKFIRRAKPRAPRPAAESAEKPKRTFNLLRGMHDVLPREEKYRKPLYQSALELADFFQFSRIETPIMEEAGLFIRSIGRGTDIVDKEMYVFEDRDGNKICLRPENTAAIARAYIMHGMWNMPLPTKLWYWGPMFRYDRPQAGRYRQFYQVGYETLGDGGPAVDAELILIAYNFCQDAGVPVEIHLNSIGTPEERKNYKTALVDYYRAKRGYLCDDCKARLHKNPLRLLDCKNEKCQPVKDEAPQITDWLGEESKSHFMKVLEYLDELTVPYTLRHTLVRGLDYYTRTVFEIYPSLTGEAGAQSALGGGGRYDLLVEEMGGKPTPAAGFSIGIERMVAAIRAFNEANGLRPPAPKYDLYLAQLGDSARQSALRLLNVLRKSGLKVSFNLSKNSLKSQLESANSLQVPYALIIGQKEVQDNTAVIRDMESGTQEIVDQRKIDNILKKKLGKM
ncbi:histidine--tRNA ligase [Patescibacteria group bacterium]|nr:MAG: histidine--tRNA ligase [Patescibacteria group bacterium]